MGGLKHLGKGVENWSDNKDVELIFNPKDYKT
jgi:hypothetical protein